MKHKDRRTTWRDIYT